MKALTLPPGAEVGRFRIVSALGAGGMGEVYLAEDPHLRRKVALKILPPEFVSDTNRLTRFEREARAASALNHPAILTIHDLGQASGIYYIATEFIEGETLRARLSKTRLKLREALEIAIQVAGAVSAAHSAGIVHRDVKPENVMIRNDGLVKVLDFGLAKLASREEARASAATERFATSPGTVLGTVHYMSPEQALGRNVDERSDIFSLGTVLYEMVTGRVPFTGATLNHVIVSIAEQQPAPVSHYVSNASSELQRIVSKALAKDPEERYQVAKDLLIDLRALKHDVEAAAGTSRGNATPLAAGPATMSSAESLVSGIRRHQRSALITVGAIGLIAVAAIFTISQRRDGGTGERISIAIADFSNTTGERELDSLSGMLITSLEQSRRLAVITRPRMFDVLRRLGRENVDRVDERLGREIALAENARALITASVSKFGQLYIVDLKVLDPETSEYTFATREEGRGKEHLPKMIDRLSERVRLTLNEAPREISAAKQEIGKATTTSLEAYEHYFRGEQLINDLKFDEATEEFRKTVALDPEFAIGWYRLAYAHSWNGRAEAIQEIQNAVRFSNGIPEKERLMILGIEAQINRDFPRGIRLFRRVLERFPHEKEAIFLVGDLSYHSADFSTARTHLERTLEMDSSHERAHQHLVWTHRDSGDFQRMVEQSRRYVERLPTASAYENLIAALFISGKGDEAVTTARRAIQQFPDRLAISGSYVQALLAAGDHAGATAEADRLRSSGDASRRAAAERIEAHIALVEGRYRDALDSLELAMATAADNRLTPWIAATAAQRALILAWMGRAPEARDMIAKALTLRDAAALPTWLPLFAANLKLEQFDAASAIDDEGHLVTEPRHRHLIAAARYRAAGDRVHALAEARLAAASNATDHGPWYLLAQLALDAGLLDEAAAATRHVALPGYLSGINTELSILYPRAPYLLGRVEEARGNRAAAKAHYRRFVSNWSKADPDIPELIDAKERLAKL